MPHVIFHKSWKFLQDKTLPSKVRITQVNNTRHQIHSVSRDAFKIHTHTTSALTSTTKKPQRRGSAKIIKSRIVQLAGPPRKFAVNPYKRVTLAGARASSESVKGPRARAVARALVYSGNAFPWNCARRVTRFAGQCIGKCKSRSSQVFPNAAPRWARNLYIESVFHCFFFRGLLLFLFNDDF